MCPGLVPDEYSQGDAIPKLNSGTHKRALVKLSAALRYDESVSGSPCAPCLVAP